MSHSEIRVAALDMDGTLLHNDSTISPHTLAVLEALIRRGVTVIPASGRNFNVLPKGLLALPGIRYGVCANGANVVRLPGGEHLCDFPIATADARTIAAFLAQYPLFFYLFSNRGTWHSKNWNEVGLDRIFPGLSFQPSVPEDLETFLSHDALTIDKMGLFAADQAVYHAVEQKGSPVPSVTIMRAGRMTLEMNAVQATKEHGIRVICERLGIPMSAVLAIGDNQNDIPMLRAAGVSVAMGNAADDVKAVADFTAATNEEDGAAAFLEEYFHLCGCNLTAH